MCPARRYKDSWILFRFVDSSRVIRPLQTRSPDKMATRYMNTVTICVLLALIGLLGDQVSASMKNIPFEKTYDISRKWNCKYPQPRVIHLGEFQIFSSVRISN